MAQSLPKKRAGGLMFMLVGSVEMIVGGLGLAFSGSAFVKTLQLFLLKSGDVTSDVSTMAALAAISSLLYCSGAAIMCLGFTRTAAARGITLFGKVFTVGAGLLELIAGVLVGYSGYSMIEGLLRLARATSVSPADVTSIAAHSSMLANKGFITLAVAAGLMLAATVKGAGLTPVKSSNLVTGFLTMGMVTLMAAGMVAGSFIAWRAANAAHGMISGGNVRPSDLADAVTGAGAGGLLAGASMAAMGTSHIFMALVATTGSSLASPVTSDDEEE